ncbi:MAG TPA: shikimate dehydrogenase [Verrucomicrobiae bacterium]|nr:shikimate dehydrogenase [Verrucomicrobiae bacterium]
MKKNEAFSLFGIFGYPLAHSLSPDMQEAAFEKLGMQAFYLVLELGPRRFRNVMARLRKAPLQGFNVTVPYKETVLPYLDKVSLEASRIGAVNTVYRRGKSWRGANTDVHGFLKSLEDEAGFKVRGCKAAVLGAGGAARAVTYALAERGAREITLINRNRARASRLAREFGSIFKRVRLNALPLDPKAAPVLADAALVVNATSVGLKGGSPVPGAWIPKAAGKPKLFFDLIYFPRETQFLKEARKKGHRVLNGTGMLVHQGARALEYWTGKKAPAGVMRAALLKALEAREGKKTA